MNFSDFRDRLSNERVAIYNYFHDHTWDDDYTKIYIYTLPGKNPNNPQHTREMRHGAHFIVKRFCDFGEKGIHFKYESKRSVFTTRHTEYVKDTLCFVIRKDVLDSLKEDDTYPAYILFETEDSFAEMIQVKELLKYEPFYIGKNQQEIDKFYYPVEYFPLHKKDFSEPKDDISYFQPKFLGNYMFHRTVHGHETNVKVYKEGKLIHSDHFDTLTDMFNHYKFDEKGAKLISIQRMFAKKQNFTFKGLTFIFDDDWELVEYKIRLSKKQKELIREIEAKKEQLAKEEPQEEEITPIYGSSEGDDNFVTYTIDTNLNSKLSPTKPDGCYWDDEAKDFRPSIDIFSLPY